MKVHRFVQYAHRSGYLCPHSPTTVLAGWYKEFRLTVDMDGVRYGAAHREPCLGPAEEAEFVQYVWKQLVRQVAGTIEDQITESL